MRFLSDVPADTDDRLQFLDTLTIAEPGTVPLKCYLSRPAASVYINSFTAKRLRLDIEKSEVIQLWRPYCLGGIIRAGRIFYSPVYHRDGKSIRKSEDFLGWAARTVSAVRNRLMYDRSLLAYVGRDTARRIGTGDLVVTA